MTKLVEFDLGDGESILMEVDDLTSEGGVDPISVNPGEIAAKARKTFEESLSNLEPMIRSVKGKLNTLADTADEIEVKFSVKLTAEVGAVVTKVGGEANYEITLKWKKS